MFWRGVLGYLPANIIQGVVGFLAIIVYTRLLSAEDFGRYALAFSVMTMAHVATFSWLEAAMARFWAAQRDGADMVFRGGPSISGVDLDLHDVGELTPVVAALAALADGPSRLRGVAHLKQRP